jgi:copper chaperone
MTELRVQVDGMTCEHCKHTIEQVVSLIQGAQRVTADFASGRVEATFAGDPDQAAVRAAIEEEGYEVVSITTA